MQQIIVYIVGTAGSGKTYLVKSFSEWLDLKKLDHITVNLDPGADFIPYPSHVDIREWFTLEDIMQRYNVGPNCAQVIGADLIPTVINEIKDEIESSSADFVIVDTPGQMELFTLRESSRLLVNALDPKSSVMVYLFDPIVSKTPSGYLSLLFMASSAIFRLQIPQVQVLSKSDVLSQEELTKIVSWSTDPDILYNDLKLERKTLSLELFLLLQESGFFRPLIPASAITNYGMEDIYDGIQELFFAGDDLEKVYF